MAEDRKLFAAMLDKLGLAPNAERLRRERRRSGRDRANESAIRCSLGHHSFSAAARWSWFITTKICAATCRARSKSARDRPVLVDRFLEDAIEVDVDCIADGEIAVIGAIMEHIEEAGIHSGDSACVIPTFSLSRASARRDRERDQSDGARARVCAA